MKFNKSKKGELTTQQIVLLIILIASFAIILFFFFRLNLQGQTLEQTCHNSVLLQNKLKTGDLQCSTSYICFSGNGECSDISPTETIKISLGDLSAEKTNIFRNIADKMYSCWWMMGEGKIDYTSGLAISNQKICALCSSFSFDQKIQNDFKDSQPTYGEFYNYLAQTKKDNSQTYLNYLYGVDSVDKLSGFDATKKFDFSKKYSLITYQINKGFFSGTVDSIKGVFGENSNSDTQNVYSLSVNVLNNTEVKELGCATFVTKS